MNKRMFRLSFKLIVVVLISGILALSFFFFAFINRSSALMIYEKQNGQKQINLVLDETVSVFNKKEINPEDKKQIKFIFRTLQKDNPYISFALHDGEGLPYTSVLSKQMDRTYYNGYLDGAETYQELDTYISIGGTTFRMVLWSFHGVMFLRIYLLISIAISVIIFVSITLIYFRMKIKYIEQLQNEVSYIETGDFTHPITHKSNDELTSLSYQLDKMRFSLASNMEKEEEARKANADLITAMSHDLKTPLTALMGYLDIIQLEKYKDPEQYQLFLKNCIDKTKQINDLSAKMFEYFLVYSEQEESERSPVSVEAIQDLMRENIDLLKTLGFRISFFTIISDTYIDANMPMMKRVFDNLFSNSKKYADINEKIDVITTIEKNQFKIVMTNKPCHTSSLIESNKIGLSSVKRIVELHDGTFFTQEQSDLFMNIITIPLH